MSQTASFKFLLKLVLVAGSLFTSAAVSFAQSPAVLSTVSPYSRFGLGDFQMNGGLINNGMGGGGIGLRNDSLIPQYYNMLNPASLTSQPLVAYEVSLVSNTVQLRNATSSGIFNRTTLGNFSLAFPVTKWWGAGLGMVPYSAVGYNVSTTDTLQDIGPVTYKYEGSGGINQVFISNGFRPFAGAPRHYLLSEKYAKLKLTGDTAKMKKSLRCRNNLSNISIGFQASYLFGSLENVRRDVFPDTSYTFNTKITKRTVFRDAYLSYGLQYSFRFRKSLNPLYRKLADTLVTDTKFFDNTFYYRNNGKPDSARLFIQKPGIRMTFGAIFSLPTEITVSSDLLAQTYRQVGTIEQFKDTVYNAAGTPGRVLIPAMGGVGFALKKDYKWMFQADYMTQLWSQMTYLGETSTLKNAHRVTAGFQYQPKQAGEGGYMSIVQYRLGVRYYQTSLELRGNQLTEMSVNFGLALPVPYRTKLGEPLTRLSMSFEYGTRGTTEASLIREDFFRFTIGVTINDRWFAQYKYD